MDIEEIRDDIVKDEEYIKENPGCFFDGQTMINERKFLLSEVDRLEERAKELEKKRDELKFNFDEMLNVASEQTEAYRKEHAKVKELEENYQRTIKEILECNPIPASERPDDRLEPPWEVVRRIRTRVKELTEGIEVHRAIREVKVKVMEEIIKEENLYAGVQRRPEDEELYKLLEK